MYNRIISALSVIGGPREIREEVIEDLENGYFELNEILKKLTAGDRDGKNFITNLFLELKRQKKRIEIIWYMSPPSAKQVLKDLQAGNPLPPDLNDREDDMTYHCEVLDKIDDSKILLMDWLIYLYPEDYYFDDDFIKDVKRYLPNDSTAKHKFLTDCDNKRGKKFGPTQPFDTIVNKLSKLPNQFLDGHAPDMSKTIECYFKMLLKNSKNGKPFLTIQDFESFIRRGFLRDKGQSMVTLNFAPGEKCKVLNVFFEYYNICKIEYGGPISKGPFIDLIFDCFNNRWTRTSVLAALKANKINSSDSLFK